MKISIWLKLTLVISIVASILVAIMGYDNYRDAFNYVEDKYGLILKHVAITGALSLSAKNQAKIDLKKGKKNKKAYNKERAKLRKIQKANGLKFDHIYTFKKIDDETLSFVSMTHKKGFSGDKYLVPAQNRDLVSKAFMGQPGKTKLYKDGNGIYISAYAPIFNKGQKSGVVDYILQVDYDIKEFLAAADEKLYDTLMQYVVILLLGIIIVIIISKRMSGPIRKLSEAAGRIREGSYDIQIDVKGNDEISDLGKTFNVMAKSLSERFHMLKYISPHTRNMIEKQINHLISEKGENKYITILFSDMRGFTEFSENRDPEEVVQTLNQLFTRQANIIERYNGSIDKYVGDQVVAIFEGPMKVSEPIFASLEIQREIESFNTENADSHLSVGIGVSIGEVIMGNIGSENRKDYTIIGSSVNLAARLCSKAGRDKVLISSDMKRSLEKDENIAHTLSFDPLGEVTLKGFSQPVHVFEVDYKIN